MPTLSTKEIDVTQAAQAYLKELLAAQGKAALRLKILSGKGCGGNEYDLQFDESPMPQAGYDVLQVDAALKIYIASTDVLKLFGSRIDYKTDELGNTRIIIENPNETGRCGCGASVTF